jgi:hypothetical protein
MTNDNSNTASSTAKNNSITSLASTSLGISGKYFQIVGWVLIILSVPLFLVIVGFFTLPFGIGCVLWGRKVRRDADRFAVNISGSLTNIKDTLDRRH